MNPIKLSLLPDYQPLKLMQAVISKVNSVCTRLLDNAELMKLVSEDCLRIQNEIPSPKYAALGVKNSRRKMEDRHVVIPDFQELYQGKVKWADRNERLGIFTFDFISRNLPGAVTTVCSMATEELRLQFTALLTWPIICETVFITPMTRKMQLPMRSLGPMRRLLANLRLMWVDCFWQKRILNNLDALPLFSPLEVAPRPWWSCISRRRRWCMWRGQETLRH